MTPQSQVCLRCARGIRVVGSGSFKRFLHGNMAYCISIERQEFQMLKNIKNFALS